MSTQPITLDLSKSQPINQPAKVTLDLSKSESLPGADQKPLNPGDPFITVDKQGNVYHNGTRLDPSAPFAPVPLVAGEAAAIAAGKALPVGHALLQGAKSALPAAGETVEGTAANVAKWAVEHGLKGGGIAGAWYLLHHFLGGEGK